MMKTCLLERQVFAESAQLASTCLCVFNRPYAEQLPTFISFSPSWLQCLLILYTKSSSILYIDSDLFCFKYHHFMINCFLQSPALVLHSWNYTWVYKSFWISFMAELLLSVFKHSFQTIAVHNADVGLSVEPFMSIFMYYTVSANE